MTTQHIGVDLSSSELSRTNSVATRSSSILQNTITTSSAPLLTDDIIEIKIIKANSLPVADLNGFSDPYCEVYVDDVSLSHQQQQQQHNDTEQPQQQLNASEKLRSSSFHSSVVGNHNHGSTLDESTNDSVHPGCLFKTNVIKKNLDPSWNETFTLNPLKDYTNQIKIKFVVMDWDRFSKDFLGSASLVITNKYVANTEHVVDLKLENSENKGTLTVSFKINRSRENIKVARLRDGMVNQAQQFKGFNLSCLSSSNDKNRIVSVSIPILQYQIIQHDGPLLQIETAFSALSNAANASQNKLQTVPDSFIIQLHDIHGNYEHEKNTFIENEIGKLQKASSKFQVIEKNVDVTTSFGKIFGGVNLGESEIQAVHTFMYQINDDMVHVTSVQFHVHFLITVIYSSRQYDMSTERELQIQYMLTNMKLL
ncbi:hypothetical protein C9374_009275 [Naegleria lovaniensis]|uniref:C2 domain-containing protein n=1 Tax=Naegleria lovaniensis TaxID=51637 RepID=A0AA88GDD7_NAELO|nr:uncharacterized protein C9374_009275 [Naegleria lovaniensis]KAG2377364.1 hypothetical protein C9374_009275 [Naegleria lovaniensis]